MVQISSTKTPAPQPQAAAVSAGHPVAADAAWAVLDKGGNAVDAGIAAVLSLTVLHCEQVQFGGICPMLYRPPGGAVVHAIDGAGRWPAKTNVAQFREQHRGRIPNGILRTVTPALPDACLVALERFGTASFSELAAPARDCAESGFPAHADLAAASAGLERQYRAFPENAAIWLPEGRPVVEGEIFRNPGLAAVLDALCRAEARPSGGRAAGLAAVRHCFYEGALAQRMCAHVERHGGWLSAADLADHRTELAEAVRFSAFGATIHSCGAWSQGPCLAQCLNLLEAILPGNGGHPTPDTWHLLMEAMRLGFGLRDAHYGDVGLSGPALDALFTADHTRHLAADVRQTAPPRPRAAPEARLSQDTSVVVVADAMGGVFVAMPSGASYDGPAVPGMGFVISTRGAQSRTEADHPACLAPGRRPRVSASPFLVETAEGRIIAGGGPGADLAVQAAVQVFMRHLAFGTDLSDALSAPRCFNLGIPTSHAPHLSFPSRIALEPEADDSVAEDLTGRGYQVVRTPLSRILMPSLCLLEVDRTTGAVRALGDPRRLSGQHMASHAL